MKKIETSLTPVFSILIIFAVITMFPVVTYGQSEPFVEYKGKVIDAVTGNPLVFAAIQLEGTNIATVTNSEGNFTLKVPQNETTAKNILVSYIGYKNKKIPVEKLKSKKTKIKMNVLSVSLAEVNVFPKNAELLIKAVLNRRNENYMQTPLLMTAFYRETIKKRRTYASLSEAVINIYKHPYKSSAPDHIKLLKARKNVDYNKLDTLVLKLMGGPYNSIILDIMKPPYMIISFKTIDKYNFELSNITKVDDRLIYVISFKQKDWVTEPLFYGSLYIDSESLAVTRATFSLNTDFEKKVTSLFIQKKPAGADVSVINASYMVSYREKDGKWFYSYSQGELVFKINWKKKLFNSIYTAKFEQAVTDWEIADKKSPIKPKDRLKTNIILPDENLGFTDKNFWGSYNVIEPEKPIENAIKKIQRNLKKLKKE
ncbi:MAG: carboxypeptidase-like regulatory domain-containing protein [Chlorobi bacterium]|nr:carboxypeptidase-like regulatory domain-containing protein [Chlorobiota bacterium]